MVHRSLIRPAEWWHADSSRRPSSPSTRGGVGRGRRVTSSRETTDMTGAAEHDGMRRAFPTRLHEVVMVVCPR